MRKNIKKYLVEHPLSAPALRLSREDAKNMFGEDYKYDLPKYCYKKNLHCYLLKSTMTYLIFLKDGVDKLA